MEGPRRPSSENQSRSLTFEGDRLSLSLRCYVTEMEPGRYERLIAAYDFALLIGVDLIGILRGILRGLLASTSAIKTIDRIAELESAREREDREGAIISNASPMNSIFIRLNVNARIHRAEIITRMPRISIRETAQEVAESKFCVPH